MLIEIDLFNDKSFIPTVCTYEDVNKITEGKHCIYTIIDRAKNTVLYVGRTKHIKRRIYQHLHKMKDKDHPICNRRYVDIFNHPITGALTSTSIIFRIIHITDDYSESCALEKYYILLYADMFKICNTSENIIGNRCAILWGDLEKEAEKCTDACKSLAYLADYGCKLGVYTTPDKIQGFISEFMGYINAVKHEIETIKASEFQYTSIDISNIYGLIDRMFAYKKLFIALADYYTVKKGWIIQ